MCSLLDEPNGASENFMPTFERAKVSEEMHRAALWQGSSVGIAELTRNAYPAFATAAPERASLALSI